MICPKCKNPNYKYVQKREKTIGSKDKWKRSDFSTFCAKCKYRGVE